MTEIEINPGFQRLQSLVTSLEENRSSTFDDIDEEETISALEKCEFIALAEAQENETVLEIVDSLINLDEEVLDNEISWLFSLDNNESGIEPAYYENWLKSVWCTMSLPSTIVPLNKLMQQPGAKYVPKSQSEWSLNTLNYLDTSPRQILLEQTLQKQLAKLSSSNEQLSEMPSYPSSRLSGPKHFKSGSTPDAAIHINPSLLAQTRGELKTDDSPTDASYTASRSESDLLAPSPPPNRQLPSNSKSISNLLAPSTQSRTSGDIMAKARLEADQLKEAVGHQTSAGRNASTVTKTIRHHQQTDSHIRRPAAASSSMLPQPKSIPRLKSRLPVSNSNGSLQDHPTKLHGGGDGPDKPRPKQHLQQPKVHYV